MQIFAQMQRLRSNSYWVEFLNKQYTEIVCVHMYACVHTCAKDSRLTNHTLDLHSTSFPCTTDSGRLECSLLKCKLLDWKGSQSSCGRHCLKHLSNHGEVRLANAVSKIFFAIHLLVCKISWNFLSNRSVSYESISPLQNSNTCKTHDFQHTIYAYL